MIAMAFKEYGNYDAVGLAGLVHRKQVTALELLDEAVARTSKVDPQINAVVVKHYDYARRQIENGLPDGPSPANFFETCDVFLCPTLCSPPLRLGELNPMSQDLSHISPILRRYMPATSMFNMSGQPAMSVPLASNAAGLPLGRVFAARFGEEATLFRLAAQLEQERPWRNKIPPICA